MSWYIAVLKQYAKFDGRARRSEYWFFTLFNALASGVLYGVDRGLGTGVLGLLYALAVIIPSIAVSVRRLHDTGRSGWWNLINFVPVLGWIVFLVFTVQDSAPGDNQYGPNPKAAPNPLAVA